MSSIETVIDHSQHHNPLSRLIGQQTFWVFVAAVLACLTLTLVTDTFATERNLFNVARNFAFVGIIARYPDIQVIVWTAGGVAGLAALAVVIVAAFGLGQSSARRATA